MPAKILCHGGVSSDYPELKKKQKVIDHAAGVGLYSLADGKSALTAVTEAIAIMEDSPLCNAGTGSFIQMDGQVRMDAALMDEDLNVGAVVQIGNVKNPIRVAKSILNHGVHSILGGVLATDWAFVNGHKFYDPRTEEKIHTWLEQWKRFRHHDPNNLVRALRHEIDTQDMLGTVGAVAMDHQGNIAAGTSTGGLKLDMPGRVGDVAQIGCGTYCNQFAAISCTGNGEKIIKLVLAKAIADSIEHGIDFEKALDAGFEKINEISARAGFIVVSKNGEFGYRFNTEAMAVSVAEETE
jgi:beta-aspartyl-peptidase (threonine type)